MEFSELSVRVWLLFGASSWVSWVLEEGLAFFTLVGRGSSCLCLVLMSFRVFSRRASADHLLIDFVCVYS